ncbi:hypothetical protein OS493_029176 [Desmophyllum pertusum]|uniref:Uncharacterized protein n=1 Tax=Desmophyllum pertusum TaxID=174260 RepID=A0A9X0D7V7_9CNID|nr:hypothetical protein OS493_029176 [Desmophyllum pertusum]
MVTGVTFAPDVPSTSLQGEDNSSAARAPVPRPLGWALKVTKRPTRMTDNVKTFLMKKFEEGARTGNKADPVQAARTAAQRHRGIDAEEIPEEEAAESEMALDTLSSW